MKLFDFLSRPKKIHIEDGKSVPCEIVKSEPFNPDYLDRYGNVKRRKYRKYESEREYGHERYSTLYVPKEVKRELTIEEKAELL